MQTDLIGQGLDLAMIGMGTVFAFLTILVLAATLMSRLVQRLLPEPTAPSTPVGSGDDTELVAVISAALSLHRSRREGRGE